MNQAKSARPWLSSRIVMLVALPSAVLLLIFSDTLWRWDQWLYDTQLSNWSEPRRDDIVIVTIDDDSLESLGHWPWPRSVHAELIDHLSSAGAKAIGMDIIFSEPDRQDVVNDIALTQAITRSGRVVLPVIMAQSQTEQNLLTALPIPPLANAAAALGHVGIEVDGDGIVRRTFLKAGIGSPQWPSLPLAMLQLTAPDQWQQLPGKRNPDISSASSTAWVRDYQVFIPFHASNRQFTHFSYIDVLQGNIAADQFRDRYVLVGASASGLSNMLQTPNADKRRGIPGVELNAQVLESLLNHTTLQAIKPHWHYLLSALLVLLPLLIYPYCRPRWAPFSALALMGSIFLLSSLTLYFTHIWLPIAAIIFVIALSYPLWSWQQLAYAMHYMKRELTRLEHDPGDTRTDHNDLTTNLEFLAQLLPFSGAQLINSNDQSIIAHWGTHPTPRSQPLDNEHWVAEADSFWKTYHNNEGCWHLGLVWLATTAPDHNQQILLNNFIEHAWTVHNKKQANQKPIITLQRQVLQVEQTTKELDDVHHFISESLGQMAGGVVIIDTLGKVIFANKKAATYLCQNNATTLRGLSLGRLLQPLEHIDGVQNWNDAVGAALLQQIPSHFSASIHGRDLWFQVTPYNPHIESRSGVLLSIADVTTVRQVDQQNAMRILMEEKKRALVTLRSIGDAVITTSAEGIVDYINPAAEKLLACTLDEVRGLHLSAALTVINELDNQPVQWPLSECLSANSSICLPGDNLLINQHAKNHDIRVSLSTIHDQHQEAIGVVLAISDISESRRLARSLEHQASHDELTGLPKRLLLNDRLQQAIIQAHRKRNLVAVFFLDLDRFKQVNDGLGHEAGDELIKITAQRLLALGRKHNTVARLSGDEFVMIIDDLSSEGDVLPIAEKVLKRFSSTICLKGHEVAVNISIGISLYPRDGDDCETLLRNADRAMYQAKAAGGDTIKFYADNMNLRAMERLVMERNLRPAIQRGELHVHYQPQVKLEDGKVIGAEALIRWQHPELGAISPSDFIPIAEETGLIIPIGEWLIKTVCNDIKEWQLDEQLDFRVSINLSPRQFAHGGVADVLAQVLEETGISGRHLGVEITEGMLMRDIDTVFITLKKLKMMNIKLAIDDFGTGYSSLSYLKRFPIDELKIDQSFIKDITNNSDDAAIATAVIAMAHSMGHRVIAEGVETAQQLEFLRHHGCDEIQGFYFSPPVSARHAPAAFARSLN
ncbi:MAG: EAL domain-containing protein [Gammaproteobacteria bacterium]|nr:EAL domain-containing protein [Gammaproteobacteria bacterium]